MRSMAIFARVRAFECARCATIHSNLNQYNQYKWLLPGISIISRHFSSEWPVAITFYRFLQLNVLNIMSSGQKKKTDVVISFFKSYWLPFILNFSLMPFLCVFSIFNWRRRLRKCRTLRRVIFVSGDFDAIPPRTIFRRCFGMMKGNESFNNRCEIFTNGSKRSRYVCIVVRMRSRAIWKCAMSYRYKIRAGPIFIIGFPLLAWDVNERWCEEFPFGGDQIAVVFFSLVSEYVYGRMRLASSFY